MIGRRILVGIVLCLLIGAALAYAFWPRPVPVDLAAVARGTLRVTVDDEGQTRIKDVYVVSAPLSGRLLRVESEVGDEVEADKTVLAVLQPASPSFLDRRSAQEAHAAERAAEAALGLAEAELLRAKAEVEFAQSEYDRAWPLAAKGTISASALDRAKLEIKSQQAALATARAALRVKQHELETAKARLILPTEPGVVADGETTCCAELHAPVDGRVLKVLRESEGVIQVGTPLIEIGDTANLEIIVDLLSRDAVKVRHGDFVYIDDWGGDAVLEGRVARVEPYGFTKISALGIEEQRVNVVIGFTSPSGAWQGLGHGYRVGVRIVVSEGRDVVVVPLGALFREADIWAAFVAVGGRVQRRAVKIGRYNQHQAEVLDGLAVGEKVVLHPSDRIAEGIMIVSRGTLRKR